MSEMELSCFLDTYPIVRCSQIHSFDGCRNFKKHVLGFGTSGTAYKVNVRFLKNGFFLKQEKASLKQLDLYGIDSKTVKIRKLKDEAELLNSLDHPNIMKLLGVCYQNPYFGLILEYCYESMGKLCFRMPETTSIPVSVLVNWALQITSGMEYLNSMQILHSGLSTNNILIKDRVCVHQTRCDEPCECFGGQSLKCPIQLKITNFGSSESIDSDVRSTSSSYPMIVQTDLNNASENTEISNIYSFGVFLWVITTRLTPNSELRGCQYFSIKKEWPEKWAQIMKSCWIPKPHEHLTFAGLSQCFLKYSEELKHFPEKNIEILGNYRGMESFQLTETVSKISQMLSTVDEDYYLKMQYKKAAIKCAFAVLLFMVVFLAFFSYFTLPSHRPFAPSSCPFGWFYLETTGYCYRVSPSNQSLEDTRQCVSENATLASIHSIEENEFINKLAFYQFENIPNDDSFILIGLVFNNITNQWEWLDGTGILENNSSFWAEREPSAIKPEHNVVLTLRNRTEHNPLGKNWIHKNFPFVGGYACKQKAD